MIIGSIWFEDTVKAKRMVVILGAIVLISLVAGGIFLLRDFYIQQSHQQVTATVTDNYISQDRRDSWSDLQFELDGQIHTVRHNVFWFIGSERELLVNSENPQQIFIANTMVVGPALITMLFAGIFGFGFLIYMANFLFNRRRDRKQTMLLHRSPAWIDLNDREGA